MYGVSRSAMTKSANTKREINNAYIAILRVNIK